MVRPRVMSRVTVLVTALALLLSAVVPVLMPSPAQAAVPGNAFYTWGGGGTANVGVIYSTPVRGAGTVSTSVSATSGPGGGGTLNAYMSGVDPINKLSVMNAFGGGTPVLFSESARATTTFAAVENASTSEHELWLWNTSNLNPTKVAWTPATGEEIQKISSVTGTYCTTSSSYSTHVMLTRNGATTKVYTWGSNAYGMTGQGSTSGSIATPTAIAALNAVEIVDVAAGCNHMLAADAAGSVWGWGSNLNGQLAMDSLATFSTPTQLTDDNTTGNAPTGVVEVEGGRLMSVVRTSTQVITWGFYNSSTPAQTTVLGRTNNSATVGRTPTAVTLPGTCTPIKITTGMVYASSFNYTHTAVLCDGADVNNTGDAVVSFGYNNYGQTGTGSTTSPTTSPSALSGLSLSASEYIVDLEAGTGSTYLLTSENEVYSWGYNKYRQLGITSAWSSGASAQLYKSAQLADRITHPSGGTFTRLFAENWAAGVLDGSGIVRTWGYGGGGMLGRGTAGPIATTTGARFDRIGVANGVGVEKIEATGRGTVAVMSDNSVWTWGYADNATYSNGDGSGTSRLWPGKIDLPGTLGTETGSQSIGEVSCSVSHCLLATSDFKIYGWGDGSYKQIAPNTTATSIYNSPTLITTLSSAPKVAAGTNYSLYVEPGSVGGTVFGWGTNTTYAAHPSTATLTTFTAVTAAGTNVTHITAGYQHSLALKYDGVLVGWGDNAKSQLGTGSTAQVTGRFTTITLPGGEAAASLHAALYYSVVRTTTGRLIGWGTNTWGVLGTGTTTAVATPTSVATSLTNTKRITSFDTYAVLVTSSVTYAALSVAIDEDGQVWSWGANGYGQLGIGVAAATSGVNAYRYTPQRVQNSTTGNLTGPTRAVAGAGWGAAYSPIATLQVPSEPISVNATAANAEVTVNWSAPTAPRSLVGYTVVARQGGTIVGIQGAGAGATSATVTGLTNGTSYSFTVYATNEAGNSAESAASSATPVTVPGAPTSLDALPSASGLEISWAAPETTGGTALTGYTVTVTRTSDSTVVQTQSVAANVTDFTASSVVAGTSYQVDVTASNAVGPGAAATIPIAIPGRPTAPTNFAVAPRVGGFTATWAVPDYTGGAAIASYLVKVYQAGTSTLVTSYAVNGGTTTATITTLSDNVDYDVTVTAAHGSITATTDTPSGLGIESDLVQVRAGRPLAPTNVTVTEGVGELTVTWDGVPSTDDVVLSGYSLSLVHSGGTVTSTSTCTASGCTETVTGLTNGTQYAVSVTATANTGSGIPSSPAVNGTPRTTPAQPATLTATGTDETLDLAWTAPTSSGGSAITGYEVEVSTGGVEVYTASLDASQLNLGVSDLTNGTSYTVEVSARNIAGIGTVRSTSATPAGPPTVPLNLTVTPGAANFVATWTTPSSTGGSAITHYTVTVLDPDGNATSLDSSTGACATATRTCTVSNVNDADGNSVAVSTDVQYTVTVAAVNALGTGPSTSSAIVVPGQPSAPRDLTLTYANESFEVCLTAPATVPSGSITTYQLGITANSSTDYLEVELANWQTSATCLSPKLGYTVSAIGSSAPENGTEYSVDVAASATASGDLIFGTRSAAGTVTPKTTPGQVGTIGAAASAPGAVLVSWSAPSDNGGSAISGYSLRYQTGGGAWSTYGSALSSTDTSASITGLSAGDEYTFELTPSNVVGAGTARTTSATAINAPAPVIVTSPNASTTVDTLNVTFQYLSTAAQPITSLQVDALPTSGPAITRPITIGSECAAGQCSVTLSSVTAGMTYTVNVVATNAALSTTTSISNVRITESAPIGTGPGSPPAGAGTPSALVPNTPDGSSQTNADSGKSASGAVKFKGKSAQLSKAVKKRLTVMVQQSITTSTSISTVSVNFAGKAKAAKALATKRAKAITSFLVASGVQGEMLWQAKKSTRKLQGRANVTLHGSRA